MLVVPILCINKHKNVLLDIKKDNFIKTALPCLCDCLGFDYRKLLFP